MKTHKQYRYRIYTEHKNRNEIQKIVADCFDGFTMFTGIGAWKNEAEKNLTIEIITTTRYGDTIIWPICKKINQLNSQDCCLVTIEPVEIAYV